MTLPWYPSGDTAGGHKYTTTSWGVRLVSQYTGLDFFQVRQLDYVKYLTWLRDAYIYNLNQTEDGREYLDNAWRMEQTAPDRSALRKKLKGEE